MENKNNKLIITMICLGVVAILVAACIGYNAWMRGKQAEEAAALLLEQQASDETYPENASTLHIAGISLELPVLWDYSESDLETTICRYKGAAPGDDGNLIITGHDFLSGAHFGRLDQVKIGDRVTLYDEEGRRFDYTIYARDTIDPNDVETLEKIKNDHELTLMTCSDNANKRLLVRCAPDQE